IAQRAPALRGSHRLHAGPASTTGVEEVLPVLQRDLPSPCPRWVGALLGGRLVVAKDDVINADAGVEAAPFVKVKHLVNRVGRQRIIDIVEGAAVAQGLDVIGKPEKVAHAQTVQSLTLGTRVLAGTAYASIDDRLADEHAVVGH